LVYCTKCGALNPDTATVCSNCGAPLQGTTAQAAQPQAEARPYNRNWRWEDWETRREYHRRSGAFAALAIGTIIILIGLGTFLAQVYNVNIPWGAIFFVFIGLAIIIAGFRARSRWKPSQSS
jgi:uncharacterized membrane protein YvbJ